MRALIDWFIDNPVAANLLLVFVVVGGLMSLVGLKQEVFPDASPDLITVTVIHPGATPEELEEGVCIKIEEQIEGLDGVKRITSNSSESVGVVMIELTRDAERSDVLEDVKTRVDAISTFPEDAERPVIVDVQMTNAVVDVVVSGKLEPMALKRVAREVRDEIAALPEISSVEVTNDAAYEIAIEVSEDALRRYGLSFDEVVGAVRQNSLNISGGTMKTKGGEILLRADTQAYVRADFEEILLLRSPHGTRVVLGDVAKVVDGLEDVDLWSTLDGEPALTLTVFRIGEQSAPTVAAAVYDYLDEKRAELPAGLSLDVGTDWSELLRQRRSLLLNNGKWGLILIFLFLALFLRLRLAFWVAIGIPAALLGAVWLLPATDTSINMMSLFGFIVVLGILVDDAIVVAENIHYHSKQGLSGPEAAKKGTREVMVPVTLAVMTTIAAFVPMLNLPGWMGKFARVIPVVVICALIFSLVESLLILPRHLSHLKPEVPGRRRNPISWIWHGFTGSISGALDWWIDHVYRPTLALALRWRYAALAVGAALLVLTIAMFRANHIKFVFMPAVEGDQLVITLTMPEGTPTAETEAAVERILESVEELRNKYDPEEPARIFKHLLVSVGAQPQKAKNPTQFGKGAPKASNLAEVFVELYPPDVRGEIKAESLMRELRESVGVIPGARDLRYQVAINAGDMPISLELSSSNIPDLRKAADLVRERLERTRGVFDISDDMVDGKREFRLFVTPAAEALGVTQAELARQVRQGFYGDEAQRIQRGRDDVKVMVRYPEGERRSVGDLDGVRIRLPGGGEVPFSSVARIEEARGPASIRRANGQRTVTVTADVDLAVGNPTEIVNGLKESFIPELEAKFPGVAWSFEGEQREQADALMGLLKGAVLAVLIIFSLLALVFGSFVQPVIVLIAIPFGLVGAVLGHMLLGLDFTMLSTIGILAMSGVVVNDSMILIDFVNRARKRGATAWEAVSEAGPRRFRAILLTSITTFAGLTPLILETSVQAQFLIPMAVSLSFGVLFSTAVILLIVPAAYLVLEDAKGVVVGARRRIPGTGSHDAVAAGD